LSPQLFERSISDKGTNFVKMPKVRLSGRVCVCERSGDRLFELERQSFRARYNAEGAVRDARRTRQRSLMANLVGVASPVSVTVNTVHTLGSEAAAVSAAKTAATRDQAKCTNEGVSATVSAFAGPLSAAVGGPSGVFHDSAPVAALETLSDQPEAAEKQAAGSMRDAARALQAHMGSNRFYFVSLWIFVVAYELCASPVASVGETP